MHTFTLPTMMKIGNHILDDLLHSSGALNKDDKVLFILDEMIDKLYGDRVMEMLLGITAGVKKNHVYKWSLRESFLMSYYIVNRELTAVVAMGGGKVLDVAKYAAYMSKVKFISIPTAISNDGVASPIAVLKCDKAAVKSLPCKIPDYIFVDLEFIKKAPKQLIKAGLGDKLSNMTALKDWRLAEERGKEKVDDFAYLISNTAFRAVLDYENKDIEDDNFLIQLAESIVLSGLAMNMAGSSRPCSGGEHLISHAIDRDKKDKSTLHGIQVGLASLIISYLYGDSIDVQIKYLKTFGLPTTFEELGLSYSDYLDVMRNASSTRPGRYTILDEIDYDEKNLRRIYEDVFVNRP